MKEDKELNQGKCNCEKCWKEWYGFKQTAEQKKKWRSPCCNAKGICWEKAVWVRDEVEE